MTTHCYTTVRGTVARFTKLDKLGHPLNTHLATAGISQVTFDADTVPSGKQSLRDDQDQLRMVLHERVDTTGYTAQLKLTQINSDLLEFLTNNPAVAGVSGNSVGSDITVRQPAANFSMELWAKLAQPIDGYNYGYLIFPRLRGGRVKGLQFSNGAVSLELVGSKTVKLPKYTPPDDLISSAPGTGQWNTLPWNTSQWNTLLGPRDLLLSQGRDSHWATALVDHAPEPTCGAQLIS